MANKKISNCVNGDNRKVYSQELCQSCYKQSSLVFVKGSVECAVDGCERMNHIRQFCHKHYQRFRKYGDPLTTHMLRVTGKTQSERFWKRVDKSADCWEWLGAHADTGYGIVEYNGKLMGTHRVSYFLDRGRWPTDFVLHSCDNRGCVNPAHLRNGTPRENMQDAIDRNRKPLGEQCYNAAFTEADVLRIRRLLANGRTGNSLAVEYGVQRGTIYNIANRQTWKHI